jgi:hypothetical protein
MPDALIKRLREKVDLHRRATTELVEDMCKVRTILLADGHVDAAEMVSQACIRIHEVETCFNDADTCLI